MTHDRDPAALAQIAAGIARRAGGRILELRERGVSIAATKSSSIDIVTEADRESERLIVEALAAVRPHDGVLGEEGAVSEGSSGVTWVVDPIDGTVNYLYDVPAYTVSIAATVADAAATADGRRAIAGAVYNPRTGELFEAWEGGGSRLGGKPIRISQQHSLAASLVATGFGYTVERKRQQLEVLGRVLPRVRDIRRIGSAAYDLCLLASGRIDAYYEIGLRPWDYAAGVLIAREAGAQVLGLDEDTPPGEPLLVAAAPQLAPGLRELAAVPQSR